jgi:hypothetical protein
MSIADKPAPIRTGSEAEAGRQGLQAADDNFRAAFAAPRGTVSPHLDLNTDPDEPCCQGRLSSG